MKENNVIIAFIKVLDIYDIANLNNIMIDLFYSHLKYTYYSLKKENIHSFRLLFDNCSIRVTLLDV